MTDEFILDSKTINVILNQNRASTERMLVTSLVELVKSGHASFLFLRDEQMHKWWAKQLSGTRRLIETYETKMSEYELKQSAYDLLSEEERKLFKLRKPVKPRPPKGYE
jgi:hypothetical protein